MTDLILKNAKIVLDGRIAEGTLEISGEKIKKLHKVYHFPNQEAIDLEGKYIVPGFIDVHIHGVGGYDVMDNSKDSIRKISEMVAHNGTTQFLATTLTATKQTLLDVLGKVGEVQDEKIKGAEIFGVHMEGPYFDSEYKGAQNGSYLKEAEIKEIKEYLDVKENLVRLFSLSAKGENAIPAIKFLKENGVVVSVGHSSATYEETIKAIKAGVTHSTHTYNAMRGFNHRDPGVVGAVLTSDKVNCEVIFDKIHVHPEAVRLLIKAKGVNKVLCITDAMCATNLPEGDYKLGELEVVVKDHQARLKSNGALAGSVLTMDKAFKNVIELGYSVFEAVKLTSTNAAKEFNLDTGIIEEGKRANLIILDEDYNVCMTIVNGEIVYKR